MVSVSGVVIPTVVGFAALWVGSKVFSIRMSLVRMLAVALLAQIIVPYSLGYLSSALSFIPFSFFLLRLFIWIGLIKFTAEKVSIMNAVMLGAFAFGVGYFLTISGIQGLIGSLLPI